ncbi:protein NEDD1-like isoform X2 [Watersipora subatra]|uniref:protein NEDD1-like isoform X2 n=1 Tax=Watersipora subatra TaxID=2589382 RepID=UPI00355AF2BB
MLASGADDLRIWDGDKYDMVTKHYSPPVQKVSSLAWNSLNTHVACIAPGGCTIDVTSVESADDPIGYPIIDDASCLCWHNSSRYLGVGCSDGAVKVYDLKTRLTKKNYLGHKAPVTSVTYNYNDTTLASSSKAGEIILHNTITDLTTRLMSTLKLQAIQAIQFSHHHHSMLASVSDDASLVLWDANVRRSVHQFARSHKAPATDLAFSPSNDRLLLSCGLDKNIVLYDALNKSIVRTLQVDAPLSSIAMHANGYQIATGTIRGHILLHDLRHGSKVQHSFMAHRTSIQCLAFHNRCLPKKNRSSHVAPSQTSAVSHESHNGETILPSQTPLTTVDLNAVPVRSTQHAKQGDIVDGKQITPSTTPRINRLTSTDSMDSIFSPDVAGDGSRMFGDRASLAVKELNSQELLVKASGDSLFSPDSSTNPTPATDLHSQSGNSSNELDKQVNGEITSISSHPTNTFHRRELPTPPTSARGKSRINRLSPDADVSTPSGKLSSIQFAKSAPGVNWSAESSGPPSQAGYRAADDPLTTRLKEDLKQQLKSELVTEIKDMVDAMKEEFQQTVLDHHFEMIKQFHLLQVHVESQTSQHSLNQNLVRENEELRAELERLKRTY